MFETLLQNVYLVGFMGAGKSTIARCLARRLGVASLDMDCYIQRLCGREIADIFKTDGERAFRDIETQTLRQIANAGKETPQVISCGGGVVLSKENREILKADGVVVHLLVDADEASLRISDKTSRPLFNDIEDARRRLEERLPFYDEVADITVSTCNKSVYAVTSEVVLRIRKAGALEKRTRKNK